MSGLPNGEEACEESGITDEQTCEDRGCCQWDSGEGRCFSDVGNDPCGAREACGCDAGKEFRMEWSDSGTDEPVCRTECDYAVEDNIVGKCVTRCAAGAALKKISAPPSTPTGKSVPAATAAPSSNPSASEAAIITTCPGEADTTDWDACGCDYDTDGNPEWFDSVYKCAKCPDGAQYQHDESNPQCHTCPPDQARYHEGQCYEEDVDVYRQVMKCNDGGTLTDAVATGDAPATADFIISECSSESFDFCNMDMAQACGCSEGFFASPMDAAGNFIPFSCPDGQYNVNGGYTDTLPDGAGWRCASCPNDMQPEGYPSAVCMGCPSGTLCVDVSVIWMCVLGGVGLRGYV